MRVSDKGNVCFANKVKVRPNCFYIGDMWDEIPGPHESVGVIVGPAYIAPIKERERRDTGYIRICKHCGCLYWEATEDADDEG